MEVTSDALAGGLAVRTAGTFPPNGLDLVINTGVSERLLPPLLHLIGECSVLDGSADYTRDFIFGASTCGLSGESVASRTPW